MVDHKYEIKDRMMQLKENILKAKRLRKSIIKMWIINSSRYMLHNKIHLWLNILFQSDEKGTIQKFSNCREIKYKMHNIWKYNSPETY